MKENSEFIKYLNSLQLSEKDKQIFLFNRFEVLLARFQKDVRVIKDEISQFNELVNAIELTVVHVVDNIQCLNKDS